MFFKRIIEKNPSEGKNGEKNAAGRDRGRGSILSRGFRSHRFRPVKHGAKKSGKNAF